MYKINTPTRTLLTITALLVIFVLVSCGNNPSEVKHISGPPMLDHVKSVLQSEPTITKAAGGKTVVIIGKNLKSTRSITFNGTKAQVNPALATDHSIIVTIPVDTPFRNASDSLVVTNAAGSASLPFHILQPPPTITDFSPPLGPPGDTLTITGKVFDQGTVRFGDETTGKVAQIVSVTPTQIMAIIPKGITGRVHVTVKTPAGSAMSEDLYGFKTIIYEDALFTTHGSWIGQAYTASYDYQNTEHVQSGAHSIKITLNGGYGALQILSNGQTPVDLSGITAITFSVYAEAPISKLGVVLNGNYSAEPAIATMLGQYKVVTVPLSELGNPSQMTKLVIQGRGSAGTFYIDNIGFI